MPNLLPFCEGFKGFCRLVVLGNHTSLCWLLEKCKKQKLLISQIDLPAYDMSLCLIAEKIQEMKSKYTLKLGLFI